jgi:ABC-type branched-subunit amino acid transport system substrate-binding protein
MNIFRTIAGLGFAASLAMTGAANAQDPGVTDKEILIGDVLPVSGPVALLGFANTLGVKAAVAEVNANGGINGRMVRSVTEDDGYVPSRTIEGVRRLLTVHKVFALTTLSGSTQGLSALSMVKEAGIPVINTLSYAPEMYHPLNENIFVAGSEHDALAHAVTSKLAEQYPGKKWGVIVQDDAYGVLMKAGFVKAVEELGLEVVYDDVYKRGQKDFSSEMLRLTSSGAEVLLMGGVLSENVAMAKELERLGSDIPFGINFVGRVPVLLQLMGSAGKNIYAGDYVATEDTEEGQAFLAKLRNYLTEDEMTKVNRFTFTAYIGAIVMFEAMKNCGEDLTRECTIAELNKLQNFETGISSPISFSPDNHFSMLELQLYKGDPETGTFVSVD